MLGALLLAGCASTPPSSRTLPATGSTRTPKPTAPASPSTRATTTAPVPTTLPVPTTTPKPSATSPPADLGPGARGPAVLALQQRLSSLGYWLGTPDGRFGPTTEQAVYALQKAAGLSRDGIVGPLTGQALAQGVVPQPRSTTGNVIEVDLQSDLLMFVQDGRLRATLNTSTGGGYAYVQDGVSAIADTPAGHFTIFRQVYGMVVDSLGQLWLPKFFHAGFAIHGDTDVPAEPVSHGCVRVGNQAMEWIWASGLAPIGAGVWVY